MTERIDVLAQRDALAKVVAAAWEEVRHGIPVEPSDAVGWMILANMAAQIPATTENAVAYGCEPGDPINVLTPLGTAALRGTGAT